MTKIMKSFMLNKLKRITTDEILYYAKSYQIAITHQQATDIATHLKKQEYDPTNAKDRTVMIKKLAQLTDLKTAQACQKLFQQLIREYKVEHLF